MPAPIAAKVAFHAAQSKTGRRIILAVLAFLVVLLVGPFVLLGSIAATMSNADDGPGDGGRPPVDAPPPVGGWTRPAAGPITTYWLGYPGHFAVDIGAPCGTPIYAPKAGTVTFNAWGGNYGNFTKLDHGGGYVTRFAHQIRLGSVQIGQSVKQGQVIGFVGTTGNSTGCHLHYEILINNQFVNPIPTYMRG